MERLTERSHGSIAEELVEEMGNPIDSVFVKKEMYKDCRHICDKNESCDNCPLYEVMRKLADYEDAEEQGLLLRLPCKVGNTVYELQEIRKRIQPMEIISVNIGRMGLLYFNWELKDGIGIYHNTKGFGASQIGKDVFLTREEAEQALKQMKGE